MLVPWRECQAIHQSLLKDVGLCFCFDVGSGQQKHLQDFQGGLVWTCISHQWIRNKNPEFLNVEREKFPNEESVLFCLFSQLYEQGRGRDRSIPAERRLCCCPREGQKVARYCRSHVRLSVKAQCEGAVWRPVRWSSLRHKSSSGVRAMVLSETMAACPHACLLGQGQSYPVFLLHTAQLWLDYAANLKLMWIWVRPLIFSGSEQWNKDHIWNPISRDGFSKTKREIKKLAFFIVMTKDEESGYHSPQLSPSTRHIRTPACAGEWLYCFQAWKRQHIHTN